MGWLKAAKLSPYNSCYLDLELGLYLVDLAAWRVCIIIYVLY